MHRTATLFREIKYDEADDVFSKQPTRGWRELLARSLRRSKLPGASGGQEAHPWRCAPMRLHSSPRSRPGKANSGQSGLRSKLGNLCRAFARTRGCAFRHIPLSPRCGGEASTGGRLRASNFGVVEDLPVGDHNSPRYCTPPAAVLDCAPMLLKNSTSPSCLR